MNRWIVYAMAAGTATVGTFGVLGDQAVNLQATTPGTAQTGHSNITGTSRAGSFRGNGSLLTNLNAASMNTGVLTLTGTSSTYIIRGSNNSGAANAAGVIGLANSATGVTYGGWFESKSNAGRALFGYASGTAGATYGIYGVASGNGGRAMFGLASNATGNTYGGWFQSNSPDGVGLFARNISGGVGLRTEGRAQFNSSNVSIGPRTTAITSNELLSLSRNDSEFAGMTISTVGGVPYYAYSNGTTAYTYLDEGFWTLNNGGVRLSISNQGEAYMSSAGSSPALNLVNSGTGGGITLSMSNSANTGNAIGVTNGGKGAGLSITMTNPSNAAAGIDLSNSGPGIGVRSWAPHNNAVWGISNHGSFAGVIGDNAQGEAVVGRSLTGQGVGAVTGRNDGIGGVGVKGFGVQDNTIGVLGQHGANSHVNGFGVRGEVLFGNGTGIGVYGQASGASQFAVFSNGDYGGSGGKFFVIDHPTDPLNKMLMHYSTEGAEPLNAYSGNARTDKDGYAWVTLPPYVEDVNRDFRYQLTVLDNSDDFVMAKVTKKLEGNRFQIRTSKGGVEVSWRVEGVRNDRHMQKFGVHDVVDKPKNWKGKYIRPELYNVTADKGVFYMAPPQVPLASDQPAAAPATHQLRKQTTAPVRVGRDIRLKGGR